MVEYIDNSVIAQMSVPDMRLCVQYALTAPHRTSAVIPPLDLISVGKLTFAAPDEEAFPLLAAARNALRVGGAMPAALNAANEVAVAAFLERKIELLQIFDTVLGVLDDMPHAAKAMSTPRGFAIFHASFMSSTTNTSSGFRSYRAMMSSSGHGLGFLFSGGRSQP